MARTEESSEQQQAVNTPLLDGCEDGSCAYRPGVTIPRPSSDPGVVATVITILFSLPALLGTCCWPLLVAGILGIAATAAARELSHTISFAVTLAMMTNLIQYFTVKRSAVVGTHLQKYGPVYLLGLATVLIMADLLRHVLMDSGVVENMGMFRDGCESEALFGFDCLSVWGWTITIGATYSGFACVVISIAWMTGIVGKSKLAFADLQSRNAAEEL